MYKKKKILALIPARGGSKQIINKNIKLLCGKPLISYTIEAALASDYIDDVVISTDSDLIAEISLKYGGQVPFMRPKELAGDESKTIDVAIHAINALIKMGRNYDYLVLLQPTSPLRTKDDIDSAIKIIIDGDISSLVSVREVKENPALMRTIENNKLKNIMDFNGSLRRQDLPKYYIFNGAIYINSIDMLLKQKKFVDEKTYPYVMDYERSIDIDEILDFKIVELIMGENNHD
ncbi:MAG TPA: acylneuraminate cytidylyltransferase family protein [Clostridiaceae bacterium]|jgi:CMP-N-acetylneuraminic acid synthetase|nr:acylneuraminate cytidylyltransferase family protein [Clostridiaceae bacterium]HBN29367.1 acylneuraminate cytidylyltransferase family protein [Clostridiaceae bacterium]HBX49328.1 acylneuraminate cytidylyltransferase family protein [Clostridiaceae bacterium]